MKSLNSTLISLCNYAIPKNNIFGKGLGDIISEKSLPEIESLTDNLLKNYHVFFKTIDSIIVKNINKSEFTYSDIIYELILIYGKERCFPFTRDLSLFCAKAYFSNQEVLRKYELLLSSKKNRDILNKEQDNPIFLSLFKK